MATRSEIDAVRDATDIVELIAESIPIKKAGKDHLSLCPFHDEKTPSFSVSREKQFYHCFGCGANGDVFDWLSAYDGLNFAQSLDELAGRAGIQLQAEPPTQVRNRRTNRDTAAIEEALHHELMVLAMLIGWRVSYRAMPDSSKAKYKHVKMPPDDPLEREYESAARLRRGLQSLYGDDL